jgi:catechol 2,3-dioxygenase-like lactoylglutathione lyase family enzyme
LRLTATIIPLIASTLIAWPGVAAIDEQSEAQQMDAHISFITLGVTDLERSLRFYRDGLGFPVRKADEEIVFFNLPGVQFALYPREKLAEDATVSSTGSGFSGFALARNVASIERVDALLATAVKAGGALVKPGQKVFWGGYSGYFSDPDGFLWEVAWNPHYQGPEQPENN